MVSFFRPVGCITIIVRGIKGKIVLITNLPEDKEKIYKKKG